MGVWQGVALDSLKFHPGLPCTTLLRPAGGRHAAVIHPLEYPTPHAYVRQDPGNDVALLLLSGSHRRRRAKERASTSPLLTDA
jgi:hypothetical protein